MSLLCCYWSISLHPSLHHHEEEDDGNCLGRKLVETGIAQKKLSNEWLWFSAMHKQAAHFTIFVLTAPFNKCAYVWKYQQEVYFSPPSKMKINQDQSLFLHYAYFNNANIVKQLGLTCNLLCLTKVYQVIELSHFRSSGVRWLKLNFK